MQSSAPHLQEEKLTGIAAQELQALSQSLTVLVAEMTKRHLLGDELQQTVIGAALQIVQRIIVFYGKYITKTNLTAADAGQLASLALKSSNGMFLQGLGSLMSGVSKTVMSVTAQDGSIVDEFKGLFTAIATDKKIEQILNKVLQTIFQAVAWRSTGRWRSTVRWRSVVLSGGVILKFDINLNDKNEKEELEQEAEIFSAPIIIINNHKLMIYGKKSHLKWQMYTFTQAELGAEWHHPEFSVKKNRRIVYSKIDPLLMKTLRRCHTYFDEVYDTLHSFVDGVKSGAFPAITLPPDEKSLQDAYTMTSWPQVISKFFPSLDAKPFEDAFHLLMKKITGSKKEENEQVQVFKDVLGEILQPLSPLKKSLYYWSKSLIKSGYNLELMPDKIRDFPVLAEDGKVYISDDGTYYVRDSQSVLRKGSLSNSGIDLRNLSLQLLMDMDKVLKKRILKVIKNEGHITLKNELLPASALEVIKDLLRLYASLETAILSKDHAFILKRLPKKIKQHYRNSIPKFRQAIENQLTAWERAREEQIIILRAAAEKEAEAGSILVKKINAERTEVIPAGLELKTQMQLEAKIQQMTGYRTQLEALKTQAKKSIFAAQSALPAIAIHWQILMPPDELMSEDEAFEPCVKVDFRQELQTLYDQSLTERSCAEYLNLKSRTELPLPAWFRKMQWDYNSRLQSAKREYDKLINIFLRSLVDETEQQLDAEIAEDPCQADAALGAQISFCVLLQRDCVKDYSDALKAKFTELTSEECVTFSKQVVADLRLADRMKTLTAQKEEAQRRLMQQAESSAEEYMTRIQKEVTTRTAALDSMENLGLEEALQRGIADSEFAESTLQWLNGLKQQMESELCTTLSRFSPALNKEAKERLIEQSIESIKIDQYITLLTKRQLILQQFIYSTRIEALRKNGNTQTLTTEYKSINSEIETLIEKEQKLSFELTAAQENLRTLGLRLATSSLAQSEIISDVSNRCAQATEIAEEMESLKSSIEKTHEQEMEAKRQIDDLTQEDAREAQNLLSLAVSLAELNTNLGSCERETHATKHKISSRRRAKVVPFDETAVNDTLTDAKLAKDRQPDELKLLQPKKEEIEKSIAQLQKNKKSRETKIALIQQDQRDCEAQGSVVKQRFEELDVQHRSLTESISNKEASLSQLKSEIAAAEEQQESQRSSKSALEQGLHDIASQKASLNQRKEKLHELIVKLCLEQSQVQIEQLETFPQAVKALIKTLRETVDLVMDRKSMAAQSFSEQLSCVFRKLNSQNVISQHQQAYALITKIRDSLQTCRKIQDQLWSDTEGLFNISDLISQMDEPYHAAETCLQHCENALRQHNICDQVLSWTSFAIDELSTFQSTIELQQKSWQEKCADKQRVFQETLKTAPSDESTSFEQILQKAAEAIKKAEDARAAVMAPIPRFSSSSWTASLQKVDQSLNGIASQNVEAQGWVSQVKDKISAKAEQGDSLVRQEQVLEDQREKTVQTLSSGTAEILGGLETQCAEKLETLEAAQSSLDTRRTELSRSISRLNSTRELEPEDRIRALEELCQLIFTFNPIDYTLWNNEQLNQMSESLTLAQQLQPEIVKKTQETVRQISILQQKLGDTKTTLAQETLDAFQTASGFYGMVCDDLSKIEKQVSTELNQFKLRRDQQNKLRDRLERLAVSLLYVVTLTLVDIQTSKAKVHHIINSINSAFSAYVASIHKSKNASLNNCSSFLISSKRYHVVLMNSIREAEILFPQDSELPRSNPQAARAKARAALPKASLLCFFKHSKNAALSLKNVKNLADQYSPEKINMLKRGS